jgi:glycosyltransferase involved in cell wall biosynthesis
MKILHVPFGFPPDVVGGTEVYVAGLARAQRSAGHEPVIAAPAAANSTYEREHGRVYRYAVSSRLQLEELWGRGDPQAAQEFARILDRERPEIVHLHAFTSAISLLCAEQIRERSIPIVFTYHTPTASCPRGTLLRWGHIPCDGLLLDHRCGACVVAAQGVPAPLAKAAEPLVRWAGRHFDDKSGGTWTALRLPELVSLRNRCVQQFFGYCARIIALADWTQRLLLINGIDAGKIRLIRHGTNAQTHRPHPGQHKPLRIGFLGRLDPTKGVHILLEALRREPDLLLQLVIYGIEQDRTESNYARAVRNRTHADGRVQLRPAVPHEQIPEVLRLIDVLAVPSQWLETGPLVVLEAFAAGVPVMGTRLGGIAEIVRDEVDGLLLEPDAESWSRALKRVVEQPALLASWRQNLREPRSMAQVAGEVDAVYEEIRSLGDKRH